jgi:hypothetical protein
MQIARLALSKSTTKIRCCTRKGLIRQPHEPDPFVALLTDPATGNKVCLVDPCILVDLTLADGLPAQVTGGCGH